MKCTVVVIAVLLLAGLPVWASNIVANGGFETGDFTGWTTGDNFQFTDVYSGAFWVYPGAQQGSYYTAWGPVGSDGSISQTLADTAGVAYTLSFWLNATGDNPSDFHAFWNATELTNFANPVTSGWTNYSFQVVGTGSDTIKFSFRDDPAYIAFDSVFVDATVPEPATLCIVAAGLVAIAIGSRRRAR